MFFRCLLCGKDLHQNEVVNHKLTLHQEQAHYGLMWPITSKTVDAADKIPMYESPVIARKLGVSRVYIRDEGQNPSGSMKDYSVNLAVNDGIAQGYNKFTVVSSGNHAVALAQAATARGGYAVVFAPASSSKLNYLASIPGVLAVGVKDAIFEDVYAKYARLELDGLYNANVSNEQLLLGFTSIAQDILSAGIEPTHILAGVGNGSYLAGIVLGYQMLGQLAPRIVPVGMKGAFPTEVALARKEYIVEYKHFNIDESFIDAAEGSIAIASYSMPQLCEAAKISGGFSLGELENADLGLAYDLLVQDENLMANGAIPEPTGIMGLAAALKHKDSFSASDTLVISFTGHGVKDLEGIERVSLKHAEDLTMSAISSRQDLAAECPTKGDNLLLIEKDAKYDQILEAIKDRLEVFDHG